MPDDAVASANCDCAGGGIGGVTTCFLLPPPPQDAGTLPDDDQISDGLSIKQRLAKHREKSSCISCHERLDPLGFPLEGIDPLGRFRLKSGDFKVDDIGELKNGQKQILVIDVQILVNDEVKSINDEPNRFNS